VTEAELFDTTIVGAGPVGLFGCFYAGLRGMKTKLIDSLPELGGQLAALYPEKYIYDMPGFPRVLARELVAQLVEQAERFRPTFALGERVETLSHKPDGVIHLVTQKDAHLTRTVVLCAGAGAFAPKRLPVPGLAEFEGRGVHYFVRDKTVFEGKRLLIVGGGDSALDWAMNLEPVAKSILLIHRRDVFRAHEDSIDWLLKRSRVETRLFWEMRCVEGDSQVRRALLFNNKTDEEDSREFDAILVNIGFSASLGPIREWGLELEGHSILVDSHMQTNLPGVYAAGDNCTYEGKIKLIATGVGEACAAVNYAKHYLDPHAKVFPGHSTSMDL
jgi:ferredoxin/flavodoxin---NADP+ reductase